MIGGIIFSFFFVINTLILLMLIKAKKEGIFEKAFEETEQETSEHLTEEQKTKMVRNLFTTVIGLEVLWVIAIILCFVL